MIHQTKFCNTIGDFMYKLSIIIPTYNEEKHIKKTIESLMNQTIGFENIEIIVVDNSSTDSTKEILTEFSQSYTNIKCFFPEGNTGTPSRGRNIGIDKATSEYIMFLDADDKYLDNCCEIMFDTIHDTKYNIAMCKHRIIENEKFTILTEEDIQDISYSIVNPLENMDVFYDITIWNKIYRRDFLKKYDIKCPVGYFVEDVYFCMQCYLNTNEIMCLNNYYGYEYNVRDTEGNMSMCHDVNANWFLKSYKTYYGIYNFFKKANKLELFTVLMKKEFVNIIGWFVRMNEDKDFKMEMMEEIYKMSEHFDFNENLDEIWADFIFKNIRKRNFRIALMSSELINKLLNSEFIVKAYRKTYDKD